MRNATWPEMMPSIQVILNCAQDVAGSCDGGDDAGVYQYLQQTGVPDNTCMQYQANDNDCTPVNTCRTCWPDTGCSAVTTYTNYMVDEFGPVAGESDMMSEIFARGPISCGIDASYILNYTGGIFTQTPSDWNIDHIIQVAGWGFGPDNNGNMTPYWIIRNSWGTYR